VVKGANLQRKWVSEATSLATYNGGKGVATGRFTIQAADGTSRTISVDNTIDLRMDDVIQKINTQFGGKVVASINAKGDGLLLTDASGGAGKMQVKDDNSTTAQDLNILGTATTTTIDGSMEKTIDITATDTLAQVQTKINELGYGLTAQIINDGSGATPFRLSLNATNSGRAGRVTLDTGTTNLDTRTLVSAQDAAVFVGSADAAQPMLITASRNQIAGVIKGVNIDLQGVSKEPVTINVTRDVANVSDELVKFTEKFNELITQIDEYTKFDTETFERGVLLGDVSISQVQREMYAMINTVVPQAGKYRILADIGMRVGQGGQLEFDADKFNTAYADDPESVEALFTDTGDAIANNTRLSLLNRGSGVQTAGDGVADFKATLRDGSTVDVSIGAATTLGQVISSINAAASTKLRAELTDDGRLKLTDLTAGADTFKLAQLNASQFLFDIGLTDDQVDGAVTGKQLRIDNALNSISGGVGIIMQQRMNRLIDPVNGIVTRQNRTLDSRTDQFKDRLESLDQQLEAKRARLERQFSGLESSLSRLQGQQQSIGNLQNIAAQTRSA
jgi:flagellar capping protein FliD